MSKLKIIQKQWESYRDAVYPNVTNPRQMSDLRNTFFAGSFSTYSYMMKASQESTDEIAEDILEGLQNELNEWRADVGFKIKVGDNN